ncbi:MAG: hypothetical protein A2Y10_11135 [Planctomycetes bacterium GWF2_41_51]|nr:MAG: hypothetical protein A2Y10_11135 [Planctomycetes bacterium GWF2_41_51]HBG28397.1 hypothetical protein [Phycisphaerales bacterium]
MELSWLTKIRIVIAIGIGVVLVGLLPWNMVEPENGFFALLSGAISLFDLMICGLLALAAGFLASAVCTPYGGRIGILAVPGGLAVWAIRSADLSNLFQAMPAVSSRLAIYNALRFEGFIWLALAGLGFIGAMAADRLLRKKTLDSEDSIEVKIKLHPLASAGLAIVATVVIAAFLLNILAADISYSDPKINKVTGQPANLQIAFAVLIAFMACGFFSKLFLGTSYIWPALATVPVTIYTIIIYTKQPVMEHLAGAWPAVFFARTSVSVLPIQMVAFGCLGAVWGYWLAVRYRFWREFES